MDIVIYTNPEVLLHKRKPGYRCYWDMSRPPKNFSEGDRIYFVVKGEVQGSFECDEFFPEESTETIWFDSNSWKQLDVILHWMFCKPFRGFRYRWWKKEEKAKGN